MMINVTQDYNLFKPYEFQRPLQQKNLRNLVSSMSSFNLMPVNPIIVTSDYEIIDGNHRYHAAKQLNLPIHYVKLEGFVFEMMVALNFSLSKWSNHVFLYVYSKMGKEEYKKFDKFMTDFNLKIETAFPLTRTNKSRSGSRMNEVFRKGKFIFDNEIDLRKKMGMALDFLNEGVTRNQFKKTPHRKVPFFDAYFKLADHPKFDQKRMIEQLKIHGVSLLESANLTNYYNQLIGLFDRGYTGKNKMRDEKTE